MIDRVEKPLDIEIHYPVILPAPLTAALHGLVGRLSRSVAIGVLIKDRLQLGLQHLLDHHLSNARHLHHAEQPTVGMPRGLEPPPDLGISTRRTAGGK